jgi:hypothetical protein
MDQAGQRPPQRRSADVGVDQDGEPPDTEDEELPDIEDGEEIVPL